MYYYDARLLDVEIGLHWSKNLPVVIKPGAKLLITDLLRQCEGKTIKHREQVGGWWRVGWQAGSVIYSEAIFSHRSVKRLAL